MTDLTPRETTVELWPGDLESQFLDLERQVNEAQAKAEEWEVEQASAPKRASQRRPTNPHSKKARELAKESDDLAASVSPIVIRFRAPTGREQFEAEDKHTDPHAEKFDTLGFYETLAKACVIGECAVDLSPDSLDAWNWRKVVQALDGLTGRDVMVPKSSLVSALSQRQEQVSKLLRGSE